MEGSRLVNISFMIPPKCDVDNVGFVMPLELLDLLRSEIAVILSWVYLESFAPDINISLYRF